MRYYTISYFIPFIISGFALSLVFCGSGDMSLLRTPDERFSGLPGWNFEPRYVEINGARVHYVDEGSGSTTILCLHGEPSWSYLYRKMIPLLAQEYRVVAFDWIGFGRSDKYTEIEDYTFEMHYNTLKAFLRALDLQHIT